MIAYVFWHRPSAEIDLAEYADHLSQFHQRLAAHPTDGFRGSTSFRPSAAPWLAGEGVVFEDWYLLENSAALDPLELGAVAAPRLESHDRVARLAATGAGGMYRLRRGEPDLDGVAHAQWFAKPPGMKYDELYGLLAPFTAGRSAALWGRQMVLGPAPEFCLHAADVLDLPAPLKPLRVGLRRALVSGTA